MAEGRSAVYLEDYVVRLFKIFAFVPLFTVCLCCRPTPHVGPCTDFRVCGVTFETMQQVLAETEAQINDNWVRMPFTRANVPEIITTVVTSSTTAIFSCPFENIPEDLTWTHKGKRILFKRWYDVQHVAVDGVHFLYTFVVDSSKRQVKLYIREVPLLASGEVQCEKHCHGNNTLCPVRIRAFVLKVRPSLAEVFTRPLRNQSTSSNPAAPTISATFTCDVNGHYPRAEFEKRIIWRFNRKIIWAHPEHLFQILTPIPVNASRPYHDTDHPMYGISNQLRFHYYIGFRTDDRLGRPLGILRTEMVIHDPVLQLPGRVECWYQADPDNDEWVINAAYLNPPSQQ